MFILAKSNEDELIRDRSIIMHIGGLDGPITYEVGLDEPYTLEGKGVTGVRFIFKYTTTDEHEFYKSEAMRLKDVEELVLSGFGSGADIKTVHTISAEELVDKFHLALRDYVLSMIDDKMGLT